MRVSVSVRARPARPVGGGPTWWQVGAAGGCPGSGRAAAAAAAAAASGWAAHFLPSPLARPAVPSARRPRLFGPARLPAATGRSLPRPPAHVPARGAPRLLLPGGRALGRAAGRGPGRHGHRCPGATAASLAATLAPGRAAAPGAVSLPGHRRRGAGRAARALLPPGRRRRPELRAAPRPPTAVARAAAADPGVLHGGTQLRGAVAEQLPAGEELVPVLGRLLGECRAPPLPPQGPPWDAGALPGSLRCPGIVCRLLSVLYSTHE